MLAKPGIVTGNTIALVAGYMIARASHSGASFSWESFLGSVCGTACVMTSACIFNNILDYDIDALMTRTRQRLMATESFSPLWASVISFFFLFTGVSILYITTPSFVPIFAVVAWFLYSICYTYLKRHTYLAALFGSIPGASPPVIGYMSAGGTMPFVAIVLFMIIVCWQMVHFYAIALRRRDDYAAAHLPVISVVKGIAATRSHIEWWALFLVIFLLASCSFMPISYVVLTTALNIRILRESSSRSSAHHDTRVFHLSLQFLFVWLLVIVISLFV